MGFIKIWERYFLVQLLKNAGMFLLIFYGLYVLIDYASHLSGVNYHHSKLGIKELLVHYSSEFSERADILIPFALLIGTIHTLSQLNIHSELVALLAGGFSLHRLLRPFILTGLVAVLLLYLNNEVILPRALKNISHLDMKYAKQKSKASGNTIANHIRLENGSILVYREFDPESKQFTEVYFIPSLDEVWRIEVLDPFSNPPRGFSADHFVSEQGTLRYKDSKATALFPELYFDEKKLSETLALPRELPLSTLIKEAPDESTALENEKAAKSLTALYQKLALPWLALLAVIGPAPFCLKFSRQLPTFMIFTLGIFGLVGIYLVMDAAIILGERQVISPSLAIFAPMGFFFSIFLYRYIRIRT